jgi:hypothetical protein
MAGRQVQIALRMTPWELEAIDGARGETPRSAWIRAVLRLGVGAAARPREVAAPKLADKENVGDVPAERPRPRAVRVLGVPAELRARADAQQMGDLGPIPGRIDA